MVHETIFSHLSKSGITLMQRWSSQSWRAPVQESACFQSIQTLQRLISVISSPLWMNGNQLVKSASVESGWSESP